MANTFRTDVDYLASAYLKNRVNGNINPFHSGWYPNYVNTGYLAWFNSDPWQSRPGSGFNPNMYANEVRNSVLALADTYSNIVVGRYGLIVTPPGVNYGPSDYRGIAQQGTWGYDNCPWLNEVATSMAGAPEGGAQLTFTLALRLEQFWRPQVAAMSGVSAGNLRVNGWGSGNQYSSNTWYDVARLNDGGVFGQVLFKTAYQRYGTKQVGWGKQNTSWVDGYFFDPVLTGVEFRTVSATGFNYGYFAVNNGYPGMDTQRQVVNNHVNQMGFLNGNVNYQAVASLYDHAWNVINYRKDTMVADLTVCHQSCHTAPHSSRGRR